MEIEKAGSDMEMEREEEENDEETQLLRDRFRLSAISIAESEAKKNGMQVSEPIAACISDLAFKYAVEHLAKDLQLFAHHAGRKMVNTEDVILAAHRNENLSLSLRTFCNGLKAKEPQSERKRKKASRKEDKATTSALETADS
ncbi:protein MHF1 homolog isoform X1 [Beta vulgaris subsp. vulgaris]|uniref:protein MHF1 homolog isoform X1 n=1 Tax=Beta vulgaris subsp. vulgaris TaxID=3555 RepID=UPI0020366B7C|nr:protein MHF1 homolog isoform X1 [Beta vulgaris subsp. vulgaris]XP_048500423.1 protein MHF1 homolog isoform X1 [Beta vulgaris subsp. vulgaris]